jgi:hypothetical protein
MKRVLIILGFLLLAVAAYAAAFYMAIHFTVWTGPRMPL